MKMISNSTETSCVLWRGLSWNSDFILMSVLDSSSHSAPMCVSIASGNTVSPVGRQAITWTNADLLSIGHTQLEQISVKFES